MNLNAKFFFDLERRIKDAGMDSDSEAFDVIKERLSRKEPVGADEFARQAIYVILAGGFSQKTAKKIHAKIMDYIAANSVLQLDEMLKFLNNKNKMNAIVRVWENRQKYRDGYYAIGNKEQEQGTDLLQQKSSYLSSLPHIGKITANHLARNLGEDVVKYDIWIQRLGVAFAAQKQSKRVEELKSKIDNGNLDPEIKNVCDEMFAHLVDATGLPRGYIDVVLWKGLQNHMIEGV